MIGHIAARQQSDITVAARQLASLTWWNRRHEYDLFLSQIVLDECRSGDPAAAKERLELVAGIIPLDVTVQADELALALISGFGIPATEPRDAMHISIAAVNGIQYLLTWNFRHIANPSTRNLIDRVCRDCGFTPPIICSPDELLGT